MKKGKGWMQAEMPILTAGLQRVGCDDGVVPEVNRTAIAGSPAAKAVYYANNVKVRAVVNY